MKLPLLLALSLAFSACEKVIFSPDPTPAPATPLPATPGAGQPGAAAASPKPKPGAWMYESKSRLDRSGELGEKGRK